MSESRSRGIWPFVFGFLAGAVVGLLLAPEKGEISRKKLKNRADELKGKINPTVDSIIEKSSQLAQTVSQKLEEVENEVSQEIKETFDDEETLPVDTSLSDHETDPSVTNASQPPISTPKSKRRVFFRNIR